MLRNAVQVFGAAARIHDNRPGLVLNDVHVPVLCVRETIGQVYIR